MKVPVDLCQILWYNDFGKTKRWVIFKVILNRLETPNNRSEVTVESVVEQANERPGPKRKKSEAVSYGLLGRDIKKYHVEMRIDFFDRYGKITREKLSMREQMKYFCYLIMVACAYKYGVYPDIGEYRFTQQRLLECVGLNFKTTGSIVGRNGYLDECGLTETITYKDLPVGYDFFSYSHGLSDDVFQYVKDIDYLLDNKPNLRGEIFKKPLFCTKRRTTNGVRLNGSFYDGKYTVDVYPSEMMSMIHDDDLEAEFVGFYYFVMFECAKENNNIIRFSNNRVNKHFVGDYNAIKRLLDKLEEKGYIRYIEHGRKGTERVIQILTKNKKKR